MLVYLRKSKNPKKKLEAILENGKIVRFGAIGYSDYTLHKDRHRMENYINRHKVNEDWNNLNKAGTWARYVLWNKPTLSSSIKDMERRFNIKINQV